MVAQPRRANRTPEKAVLLDSQGVGHGVEGGGLGDEPFGRSQGAADERVAAVGGVVQGDCFAQRAVNHGVDASYVSGTACVRADRSPQKTSELHIFSLFDPPCTGICVRVRAASHRQTWRNCEFCVEPVFGIKYKGAVWCPAWGWSVAIPAGKGPQTQCFAFGNPNGLVAATELSAMKRYTGQQALYEAISRSRAKAKRGNVLERLLPEVTKQERPAPQEGQKQAGPIKAPAEVQQPVAPAAKEPLQPLPEKPREPVIVKEDTKLRRLAPVEKPEVPAEKPAPPVVRSRQAEWADRPAAPPNPVRAWLRLRPVQLNAGRIEISVPYHIGIAVALVAILVVLAAFRIGQKYPVAKAQVATPTKTPAPAAPANVAAETAVPNPPQQANAPVTAPPAGSTEPLKKDGDHWIVLAQSKNIADQKEVVQYFGKYNIELTAYNLSQVRQTLKEGGFSAKLPSGDGYLLATKDFYDNPDRPGTDGYKVKQRIIELGKGYKAPKGIESVAAKHFSDAYGMKFTKVTGEK